MYPITYLGIILYITESVVVSPYMLFEFYNIVYYVGTHNIEYYFMSHNIEYYLSLII